MIFGRRKDLILGNPTHTAKHICNSHKPKLKPKIAKELVCFPALFCRPEKQNQVSVKIENEVVPIGIR